MADIDEVVRLYEEYNARANADKFRSGEKSWVIMDRLVDVVLAYVPGPVVEIGIGHSTWVLARHAMAAGVPFYTCDIRARKCAWAEEVIKYDKLHVFCGRSFEFIKDFSERPAVVFIDGEHEYATVKVEVDFFLPLMPPGGVLFLHDTCTVAFRHEKRLLERKKIIDTPRIRKELEKRDDVDVLTWRYTAAECGLTMVLKKDMTEPEYRR